MAASGNGKNPGPNPADGELVAQPHGGALKHGSSKELPNPGAGRPASLLKRKMLNVSDKALSQVDTLLDDSVKEGAKKLSVNELTRIVEVTAAHALKDGKTWPRAEVLERVQATLAVLTANLSPEIAEDMINRIEPIWRQ